MHTAENRHAEQRRWGLRRARVAARCGTAGNLTSDAHLAALAVEHGAELCSTDVDLSRFSGLRWVDPLACAA